MAVRHLELGSNLAVVPDPVAASSHSPRITTYVLRDRSSFDRWYLNTGKRGLDLVASLLLGIVALPIVALVLIATWATLRANPFLVQDRVGQYGRTFRMIRIRTTKRDRGFVTYVDDDGVHRLDSFSVERPTRLGHILRLCSLDELPQLLNVLRGDMSLIGPRPEAPRVVARYVPWQHLRHSVKPGLTGWWQVNDRASKPMHENTHLDIHYVEHVSANLDATIVLRTFGATLEPVQTALGYRVFLKRCADLLIASILLVPALPILALALLVVRIDSSGNPIFRQQRLGQNGKLFTLYKVRTMVDGAESILIENPQLRDAMATTWKLPNDPRMTRVGRYLRKTSIDEIPQLLNVLRGDMSLIGPRPYLPHELNGDFGFHAPTITSVKPGITGLWQVSGRSHLMPGERIHLDCEYTRHVTPTRDVAILARTVIVVLRSLGAH